MPFVWFQAQRYPVKGTQKIALCDLTRDDDCPCDVAAGYLVEFGSVSSRSLVAAAPYDVILIIFSIKPAETARNEGRLRSSDRPHVKAGADVVDSGFSRQRGVPIVLALIPNRRDEADDEFVPPMLA